MGNPLLDKDFLRELDLNRNKVIYARLTSLDFNENPIEYIEGKVTGGSINVDGTSVIRRTCNLTLISQNVNINDFYWGLNTKINLEIGVQNSINKNYPSIIWFKQGIFVITTFNTSIGTNQSTISIAGKDKGCLLNGDIAGNLPASVDFGTFEQTDDTYEPIDVQEKTYNAYTYYILKTKQVRITDPDTHELIRVEDVLDYELDTGVVNRQLNGGSVVYSDSYPNVDSISNQILGYQKDITYYQKYTTLKQTKLKLYDIIREAVHLYAKEQYQNIIINDLDNYGLELLQYNGDKEIYMLRAVDTGNFEHISLNANKEYYLKENDDYINSGHTLEYFKDNHPDAIQDSRIDDWNNSATQIYFYPTRNIKQDPDTGAWYTELGYTKAYTVAVINVGETTGYRMTDLVYNGDLIANVGETLSSILDKIKNMLGDFEYFYDINGHFIFQRKKTFVNVFWNNIVESNGERFVQSLAETSAVTYNFEGNVLLTAIQQSPVLNNLKNDYSIWGKRKSISGAEIPIHLRYAIHKKPKYYRAFDGNVYTTDKEYAKSILAHTDVQTITRMVSKFADFELEHLDEYPPNLVAPTKKANGLWTPGWWDIRDWASFYKLIMDTDEDPPYTMKWYSYNSIEGCVPVASLNIPGYTSSYYQSAYCWLVVVSNRTLANGTKQYSWNFQHGTGIPTGGTRVCEKYYSYYDPENDNSLVTRKVEPKETEVFVQPFSGCSDNHTYLNFLTYDVKDNQNVYFYNPQFPDIDDLETFIEQQITTVVEDWVDESIIHEVDWREIIYQMAIDYYRYNTKPTDEIIIQKYIDNGWDLDSCGDAFLPTLIVNNKIGNGDYLYPIGYTGYEQYYSDMQGFWRQLYCPDYDSTNWNIRYIMEDGTYQAVDHPDPENEGYYERVQSEYVAPKVSSFICDFYLPEEKKEDIDEEIAVRGYGALEGQGGWSSEAAAADCNYDSYFNDDYKFWARNVIDNPAALNFWIDFLDSGELGQFEVSAIGARQKVVNDDNVTSIYNKEVPDIIFVDSSTNFSTLERKTGYTYCKLNTALENLFTISALGKSAKELLDELLYKFSYCIENITLTSLPIYYLEPNTRIFVHDDKTKIDGDYIVTKFTLPLATTGTMSITANKAPQRIY